MAKTVLEYVQGALSIMDSDEVDSISETTESQQIAYLLRDVYEEFVQREDWPFLRKPVELTSTADPFTPTQFLIPPDVRKLEIVRYNVDESTGLKNRKLYYLTPEEFLSRYGQTQAGSVNKVVVELGNHVKFSVQNNQWPTCYTSFDDASIYCNSFKESFEETLTGARVSAVGIINPTFSVTDLFVPLLPASMEPMLTARINSAASITFKQIASQDDERRHNRQYNKILRDQSKVVEREYYVNKFGRHSGGTSQYHRYWSH